MHPAKTQISLGIDPGFFMWSVKTLIRLGRCPGWSVSSLGTQIILLFLSCRRYGSFLNQFLEERHTNFCTKSDGVVWNTEYEKYDRGKKMQLFYLEHINEPHHDKTCFCHMGTTKALINQLIRAVNQCLRCSLPGKYSPVQKVITLRDL